MLQGMDSMEASCIFDDKVGMVNHHGQIQTWLVTVNKVGIVWLTVKHHLIGSVSFMYYSSDCLRQTSADYLFREDCPIDIWQWCDYSCRSLQFIPQNKLVMLDWLIVSCMTVGDPSNLLLYAPGFNWSIMYNLAATYGILTWSKLFNLQDFSLLFMIIFLSHSTPPNHGFINTSTLGDWSRIKPKDGWFCQYITQWHTARMPSPVSPQRRWQGCHQIYDPGCTFRNCP